MAPPAMSTALLTSVIVIAIALVVVAVVLGIVYGSKRVPSARPPPPPTDDQSPPPVIITRDENRNRNSETVTPVAAVHIINLASRPDRLKAVREVLARSDLRDVPVMHFTAVVGKALPLDKPGLLTSTARAEIVDVEAITRN